MKDAVKESIHGTGRGVLLLRLVFRDASHVVCSQPFSYAQPFTVPCCTSSEPWKAQLRVFLPLQVLVKVSHTTCGIL